MQELKLVWIPLTKPLTLGALRSDARPEDHRGLNPWLSLEPGRAGWGPGGEVPGVAEQGAV